MYHKVEIQIDSRAQKLYLSSGADIMRCYSVSTAKNGLGERRDSGCTPRGRHLVRCKIGEGMPANTVYQSRRPTGVMYSPELADKYPGRDWILGRILWLSGVQPGFNRLGLVDTMQRYIYIHGAPSAGVSGVPDSKGCIRMHQQDIVELFSLVPIGCSVLID